MTGKSLTRSAHERHKGNVCHHQGMASVKCNFCRTKVQVDGETLPPHETEKGSGVRCDGSGLPVESMDPSADTEGQQLTDGGATGKAS